MRPALGGARFMARGFRIVAVLAALSLLLVLPGSAGAFPLTTCTLTVSSFAADGTALDTAASGADDATRDNPFDVDWDGQVAWSGTTGNVVFTNFTYSISISGLPTPLQGAVANTSGAIEGTGTVVPSDVVPLQLIGLFFVSGSATASDGTGSCEGSGWVRIQGDLFASLQFWVALALLGIGALIVVVGRGGRWLLGLIGGALFGLGGAVMLITVAFLPLGEFTPLIVLGLGVVLGLAITIPKGSQAASAGEQPPASTPPPSTPPPSTPPASPDGSADAGAPLA